MLTERVQLRGLLIGALLVLFILVACSRAPNPADIQVAKPPATSVISGTVSPVLLPGASPPATASPLASPSPSPTATSTPTT
jgi:hypothetical protein